MHQTGMLDPGVGARVPIVLDALDEAARAVANADDPDPDFRHSRFPYPSLR